jgi:hypothetical protein
VDEARPASDSDVVAGRGADLVSSVA